MREKIQQLGRELAKAGSRIFRQRQELRRLRDMVDRLDEEHTKLFDETLSLRHQLSVKKEQIDRLIAANQDLRERNVALAALIIGRADLAHQETGTDES